MIQALLLGVVLLLSGCGGLEQDDGWGEVVPQDSSTIDRIESLYPGEAVFWDGMPQEARDRENEKILSGKAKGIIYLNQ